MKKFAITAVLVGALGLAMAPSVMADEGRHNMDLNTANNFALELSLADCNIDPACVSYNASCRKASKHKAFCTIINNESNGSVCTREIALKLRRSSFVFNVISLGSYHCT